MNELAVPCLTMSTLEIAGLTGKRHGHVLRDARNMMQTLSLEPNQFWAGYLDSKGETRESFQLPKRESLILVSGYSIEMRARIIDRWLQLEAAVAQPTEIENLPADVRKIIGGIVKSVVHHEVAHLVPSMVEDAISRDTRRAVLEYVSVRELLDEAKAIQKGRGALNRKIGFHLRERAHTYKPDPVALRRCAESGVWLFPRDFAYQFMTALGLALVAEHNAKIMGQGVLAFPARGRKL